MVEDSLELNDPKLDDSRLDHPELDGPRLNGFDLYTNCSKHENYDTYHKKILYKINFI